MWREQSMVREFHQKFELPIGIQLQSIPPDKIADTNLNIIGKHLIAMAKSQLDRAIAEQDAGDARLYRLNLLLEEVGELAIGLGKRDEVESADALGDIEYVLLGAAVTMDIPLSPVFNEVHRSNMSKNYAKAAGDRRMRIKGSDYRPPDIAAAIADGRNVGDLTNIGEGPGTKYGVHPPFVSSSTVTGRTQCKIPNCDHRFGKSPEGPPPEFFVCLNGCGVSKRYDNGSLWFQGVEITR
jgi:NTP pyrophosphatase (non-canonical NTP hydrolase)